MRKLVIAKEFSDTPGGRTLHEGEFSGEEFREKCLEPAYEECIRSGKKLVIDFDGCYGFGTSFLEEAFGGLVRKRKERGILNNIILISNDDEIIPTRVTGYIRDEETKIK